MPGCTKGVKRKSTSETIRTEGDIPDLDLSRQPTTPKQYLGICYCSNCKYIHSCLTCGSNRHGACYCQVNKK